MSTTMPETRLDVHVRWMVRRDLAEVLEIDALGFSQPWDREGLTKLLRQVNVVGMVAERGDRVVGYMVYRLGRQFGRGHFELERLAVHPDARGRGVGRQLMDRLRSKLRPNRRLLMIAVPESNLSGQKFLRAVGVPATMVSPGHFDDGGDAYLFEFRLPRGTPAGGDHAD